MSILSKIFMLASAILWVLFLSAPVQAQSSDDRPDQVWEVEIRGNETFSDILIKERIATSGYSFWQKVKFWRRSSNPFNEVEVKKDVIRIRNYYNRRGFPNVSVAYQIEEGSKPWKKEVIFTVNEQAPIRIGDVGFAFSTGEQYRQEVMQSDEFIRERRSSEFESGERYEPIEVPEVEAAYQQMLKNLGFAYASVSIQARIDTAQLQADLTIDFSTGPMTFLEQITVEGDSTISGDYIVRESGLKPGNKYTLTSIQEAQREIFNHHLFRFVTINIPEQPKDSTLDLNMQIREHPLRLVEASIGFGTEEYLRGQLSWTHRNVFRKAHKFTARAKASFIEQTLNLDYLVPYLFNTKSSYVVSPFAQHLLEPSFELSRLGITNSLIYQYSQKLTGSVSYQFTRNAELSQQLNESLPDTTQNYDLSSLQFSAYYNEGFGLRGQKGWVVQPYAELSGFFGSSSFQFQKLSLDVRRYMPLSSSTTLALRVQGGRLFSAQEDSLPNNIRFYLGGTSSIRGWGRDQLGPKRAVTDSLRDESGQAIPDTTTFSRYIPVGGRNYFGFNLEIRQEIDGLIEGLGFAAFLDGGQVWRKNIDLKDRPLQFGVGGGVRYESPIGPVRLDVGYKVNPSDQDLNIYRGRDHGNAWDRIGIHVSIGQAF